MAENPAKSGRPLTPESLAGLVRLTRSLASAVTQGDLDRALNLLEERQQWLKGLVLPEKPGDLFWQEVEALRILESEVLHFCRRWQGIIQERLRVLAANHHLLRKYNPPSPLPRFVDLQK